MPSDNVKMAASNKAGQSPDPVTIDIVEVSPRDGLQNEQTQFSKEKKLKLINFAIEAGMKRIEVTSFVNPCLLYTSPSPRDQRGSRMPSSA